MTGVLIFISIMMNIIALLGLVLLYSRQNRLAETEKRQEQTLRESEQMIAAYLLEIKEENSRLIEHLARKGLAGDRRPSATGVPKEELRVQGYEELLAAKSYGAASEKPPYTDEDLPLPESALRQADELELEQEPPSLVEQVKALYNKGHTIDEIAKILHKGKTEIELLVKFQIEP